MTRPYPPVVPAPTGQYAIVRPSGSTGTGAALGALLVAVAAAIALIAGQQPEQPDDQARFDLLWGKPGSMARAEMCTRVERDGEQLTAALAYDAFVNGAGVSRSMFSQDELAQSFVTACGIAIEVTAP